MDRIEREKKIVARMISIYCRRHHRDGGDKFSADGLCGDCRELRDYCMKRLTHCRHGNNKSSCRKCATHCYAPAQREKIREVMRYVGPRMLLYSPIAAIRHLLDEMR